MNMIDKLKDAGGIFCPNESSTMGMLRGNKMGWRESDLHWI
jgi:hypothetical protein